MANIVRWRNEAPEAYVAGYDGPFRMSVKDFEATVSLCFGLTISFFLVSFCLDWLAKQDKTSILARKTRCGTPHSELVAYLILSCFATTTVVLIGAYGWIKESHLIQDRLYGEVQSGSQRYLSIVMLAYQSWNIWMAWRLKDYRSVVTIGHHLVVAILAYFTLFPFLSYYALFFFGLPELSTIPLWIVDSLRDLQLKDDFPNLFKYSKMVFGASFLLIRCICWPIISFDFWVKVVTSLSNQDQVHSVPIMVFFLFGNIFLTSLQFYWGIKIVKGFIRLFKKREKKEN